MTIEKEQIDRCVVGANSMIEHLRTIGPILLGALFLLPLIACGTGSSEEAKTDEPSTGVTEEVTSRPEVSQIFPEDGSIDVPINTGVWATFSEPIDPSTLTILSFSLRDGQGTVSASVHYDGTSAVLSPSSHLAANTMYTAALSTAIKGSSGNALAADFAWTFTTGEDPNAPTSNAGPDQNVVVGNVVNLDGSGSSDHNNLSLAFSWILQTKPTGSVAALLSPSSSSPSFLADLVGTYIATLVVNNGVSSSRASTVTVTATAAPATANLVSNGSFDVSSPPTTPPLPWAKRGIVTLANVNDSFGDAISVSGRTAVDYGVRQDIQANLSLEDNGQPVLTRLKIKLALPATVRVFLNIVDDLGTTKIQLAEKTVRVADQFVDVQGINTIAWTGTLITARLFFEIGQQPESVYPDFVLDSVWIELDSDRDGLPDSEEINTTGTIPYVADSDLDGLPDNWEITHNQNPFADDADLDPDGDGFTNAQEYWAATNPEDANLYPGKPANPNLNAAGQAILRYLALLPSNSENRVLAGQHVTDAASTGVMGYDYSVTALGQQTGKELAIVEFQYDGLIPIQYQIGAVNQVAEIAWNQGRLVQIKWNPWNPWSETHYNDTANFSLVDIAGMLAQNSPENQQALVTFNGYLDTVAAGLDVLQQKNIVVLWRFMSEMNGAWFWWGRRPQADYVALWQYIFNYFTDTKQLHNLIWVYESDSGVHNLTPSDYYFPGANFVDVVGHNMYDDTWQLPYDLNALYREYGKVYAFPQAGSDSLSPVRLIQYGWDSLVMINAIKAYLPRASYFCAWDTGNRFNSIIDMQNAAALLNDTWVVTADELPAFP